MMEDPSEDGVADFGRVRWSSGVRGGDVEGFSNIGEGAGERGKQGEQRRNKAKQKETTTKPLLNQHDAPRPRPPPHIG